MGSEMCIRDSYKWVNYKPPGNGEDLWKLPPNVPTHNDHWRGRALPGLSPVPESWEQVGLLVSAERTKRGNVHSPPDLRSRTGNVTVPTPQSKKVQFTVPHSKPELHPTPSLTRKNVPLIDRGANNTIASGDTAIAYPQQDPHEWRLVAYRGAPHLSHKQSAQILSLIHI